MTEQKRTKRLGRPPLGAQDVKKQVSIFLSEDELNHLKYMAQLWAVSVSQMAAKLVNTVYESKLYLEGYDKLNDEEKELLLARRAHVNFLAQRRRQAADTRNNDRRNGIDRSLTNVMVIEVAPEKLESFLHLPGIFCRNMGPVWVVPFYMLYKLSVVQIMDCKCYASVVNYFQGKALDRSEVAAFVADNKGYVLGSEGEKSVLKRLTSFYHRFNINIPQHRKLTEDEANQLYTQALEAEERDEKAKALMNDLACEATKKRLYKMRKLRKEEDEAYTDAFAVSLAAEEDLVQREARLHNKDAEPLPHISFDDLVPEEKIDYIEKPVVTIHRGRGRPKGSRSKPKILKDYTPEIERMDEKVQEHVRAHAAALTEAKEKREEATRKKAAAASRKEIKERQREQARKVREKEKEKAKKAALKAKEKEKAKAAAQRAKEREKEKAKREREKTREAARIAKQREELQRLGIKRISKKMLESTIGTSKDKDES